MSTNPTATSIFQNIIPDETGKNLIHENQSHIIQDQNTIVQERVQPRHYDLLLIHQVHHVSKHKSKDTEQSSDIRQFSFKITNLLVMKH